MASPETKGIKRGPVILLTTIIVIATLVCSFALSGIEPAVAENDRMTERQRLSRYRMMQQLKSPQTPKRSLLKALKKLKVPLWQIRRLQPTIAKLRSNTMR